MSEKIKSTSLSDQALELCAILDKYMCGYMDYLKSQGLFDEDDNELMTMMEGTISITKLTEMLLITWAEVTERTEHKVDKVLKKLDDLECK